MKALSTYPAALLALGFAAGLAVPAVAQQRSPHAMGIHPITPQTSVTSPASSPFEQQVQQGYVTQLQQTQRELLQQNPSGLTRQELSVGRELNSYGAPQ